MSMVNATPKRWSERGGDGGRSRWGLLLTLLDGSDDRVSRGEVMGRTAADCCQRPDRRAVLLELELGAGRSSQHPAC